MKEIKEYLTSNKNFSEGVKLLVKKEKKLKPSIKKFLENEAKSNKPSKIALQMLEKRLRRLLRITEQKNIKKDVQDFAAIKSENTPADNTSDGDDTSDSDDTDATKEDAPNAKNKSKKK